MKILNLKCKLTNCYLLKSNCGWIMIDTDFPDTFYRFLNLLKQSDIDVKSIKYLIVTHFHPDHAGFAEDLKELGVKLILHENQIPYIDKLNNFFKKDIKFKYKDITAAHNIIVSSDDSRSLLRKLGIEGEMVQTPGHTEDSISLIIDENCAFTGDLPGFYLMEAYDDQTIKESWKLIQGYKVTKIYPAHGNSYAIN
jgi:glyoxylase-like metal-dependent hydrolase (beta-lactamase superfamily II)